ncbi:MAG: tetratricopeptide repeat protein [Proteobacteria bacterium]|nr:tetratricopeptide repeat protein [Desulfobacteraceae bacterium]MBU4012795.1 tetratricopeptide repeat protein [Pseudomonadota bacterium]MBU4067617.1 tetratricopeptide repeat protein [Pseudomonadota bacterium]MBU4101855.1 tetratricopeptide repeat protein [Pseudomonadota bacterium]
MKTNHLVLSVFLIFCIVSCAANIEMRKKQEEASRNLGEAYMQQGDFSSALRELLKADKIYPKDPLLQNDLGLAYMAKGRLDLAVKHFTKAVKLKPDYAPAKNNLGTAYVAKREWDMAISCFKEIIDDILYATPHYPLTNLGWAYYNKQEYELAEKYYREALKLEPNFIIALRGLGLTYIAMERAADAVVILEKAVKNYPRSAEACFYLARAYSLSREYEKAIKAYNKVIELAPDSAIAVEARKEIKNLQ